MKYYFEKYKEEYFKVLYEMKKDNFKFLKNIKKNILKFYMK